MRMRSNPRLLLSLFATGLLLTALPLLEGGIAPLSAHLEAIRHGRPLRGFPPAQLRALADSLAGQELEARQALAGAGPGTDHVVIEQRLERVGVQRAQVRQELLWTLLEAEPLAAAGVGLMVLAALAGGLGSAWRWGRSLPSPLPPEAAADPAPPVDTGVLAPPPRSIPLPGPGGLLGGLEQDAPLVTAGLPLPPSMPAASSPEVARGPAAGPGRDASGAGTGASSRERNNPTPEGWVHIVREPVPPLEMAHLIGLFVSEGSRDYLGLIGFLSHQLAIGGARTVRLLAGRRGVQVFLSTAEREQEIGTLPEDSHPGLVAALSERLGLERQSIRLLLPGARGYQLQELRRLEDGIELRALGEASFLPAGWR